MGQSASVLRHSRDSAFASWLAESTSNLVPLLIVCRIVRPRIVSILKCVDRFGALDLFRQVIPLLPHSQSEAVGSYVQPRALPLYCLASPFLPILPNHRIWACTARFLRKFEPIIPLYVTKASDGFESLYRITLPPPLLQRLKTGIFQFVFIAWPPWKENCIWPQELGFLKVGDWVDRTLRQRDWIFGCRHSHDTVSQEWFNIIFWGKIFEKNRRHFFS